MGYEMTTMTIVIYASVFLACLYAAHSLYKYISLGISNMLTPRNTPAPVRAAILTNKITHTPLLPPGSKTRVHPSYSINAAILSLDALHNGSLALPLLGCGIRLWYLFRFRSL